MSQQSSDIPRLLILPASALVLHEEVDARRVEPLVERLRQDGFLKNPPIAAPTLLRAEPLDGVLENGSRYVVLDGANRTTALRKLGVPHHLVQAVDYQEVDLGTWGHLVTGIAQPGFARSLTRAGLELESTHLEEARQRLALRDVAATVAYPDGRVFAVLGGGSLAQETEALRCLVSIYNGRAAIHRVKGDDIAEFLDRYDAVAGLIRFPRYTRDEIVRLADEGHKLPTGITRHIIQGRALRVNLPLSILVDETRTTQQKNDWLHDWIKHKLACREIRYYQESTFLFDE